MPPAPLYLWTLWRYTNAVIIIIIIIIRVQPCNVRDLQQTCHKTEERPETLIAYALQMLWNYLPFETKDVNNNNFQNPSPRTWPSIPRPNDISFMVKAKDLMLPSCQGQEHCFLEDFPRTSVDSMFYHSLHCFV